MDDATDPARSDPFAPPAEPCECYCLHCQRVVMSSDMWLQRVVNGRDGFDGFWMCPTPNCDGKGFTFDLFPTDPDHPGNAGWFDDGDDGGEADPVEEAEPFEPEAEVEYDPAEPQYADLDPDDIEGEEWKHGLQPGEPLPDRSDGSSGRSEWEARQREYDEPDRRPRTVDGSQWPSQRWPDPPGDGGEITEDDIPF